MSQTSTDKSAVSPPKGPFCARCRNHGLLTPRKGHSICPYKSCQCDQGCYLIRQRKLILEEQNKLKRKDKTPPGGYQKKSKKSTVNAISSKLMVSSVTGKEAPPDSQVVPTEETPKRPLVSSHIVSPHVVSPHISRYIAVLVKVFPEHTLPSIMSFIESSNGDLLTTMENILSCRELHMEGFFLSPSNIHGVTSPSCLYPSSHDNHQAILPPVSKKETNFTSVGAAVTDSFQMANGAASSYIVPNTTSSAYHSTFPSASMQIHKDQNFANSVAEELAKNLAYKSLIRHSSDYEQYATCNGFQTVTPYHRQSFDRQDWIQRYDACPTTSPGGWWMADSMGPAPLTANMPDQMLNQEESSLEPESQASVYTESSSPRTPSKLSEDTIDCLSDDQDVPLDNITPTFTE